MTVAKHTHHTSRALAPFGYPEFAAEPVARRICRGFPYVGVCTTPMARDNVANTLCASCLDRRAKAICEGERIRESRPQSNMNGGHSERSQRSVDRCRRALEFRVLGWQWSRIAEELGYASQETLCRQVRAYRAGTLFAQRGAS